MGTRLNYRFNLIRVRSIIFPFLVQAPRSPSSNFPSDFLAPLSSLISQRKAGSLSRYSPPSHQRGLRTCISCGHPSSSQSLLLAHLLASSFSNPSLPLFDGQFPLRPSSKSYTRHTSHHVQSQQPITKSLRCSTSSPGLPKASWAHHLQNSEGLATC